MVPDDVGLRGGGPCRHVLPIHAIGRASVKRAMRPELIIEGQIAAHPLVGVADSLVGVQIDLFIFETPPQPFDEDIVPPPPRPIHTDLNAVSLQESRKLLAGELAALIGVEDLRRAIPADRLLHGLHAEVRRQRIGQPPRQHPATRPIEDRTEIHKPAPHRNVGDIGRPHMIRSRDRQRTQQIGINLMGKMRLAGPRLPIDRREAHPPHQRDYLSPPNGMALLP